MTTTRIVALLALLSAIQVGCRLHPPHSNNQSVSWAALVAEVAGWRFSGTKHTAVAIICDRQMSNFAQTFLKVKSNQNSYEVYGGDSEILQTKPWEGSYSRCIIHFYSSADSLSHFMFQPQENRYWWSSRHKHLIILPESSRWQSLTTRSVLYTMWKKFKVLDVVLMSVAVHRHPTKADEVVYTLDPFAMTSTGKKGELLKIPMDQLEYFDVLHRQMKNMRGGVLRVSAFSRHMSFRAYLSDGQEAVPGERGGPISKYRGIDARILEGMAQYFNLTPMVTGPKDHQRFGTRLQNGSFTGALGDIVNRRSDIAFNSVFQKSYDTDGIEFLRPFSQDSVCLIVPKASLISKLHLMSLIFTPLSQFCFFLIYVSTALVWTVIIRVEHCINKHVRSDCTVSRVFMDSVNFLALSGISRRPRGVPERCLVLSSSVFFMVICFTIQAKMVSVLYNPIYQRDIDTLQELDESGLPITANGRVFADILGEQQKGGDMLMNRLVSKVTVVMNGDNQGTENAALYRNTAAIARASNVTFGWYDGYRDPVTGAWLLHMVAECPRVLLLSYTVPRGSPYLPAFNIYIGRVLEAGLVAKWEADEFITIMMEDGKDPLREHHTKIENSVVTETKLFSMRDLQMPFTLWCVGITCSIIIFALEIGLRAKK